MRLCIKTKTEIDAVVGKKPLEIQKIGPFVTYFNLPAVHAFSEDEIKYIMKELPEYKRQQEDIKKYVNRLEGNKEEIIRKLKELMPRSFSDVNPMDLKFKVTNKFKSWIEFDCTASEDTDYRTNIDIYDPLNNNVLMKLK